MNHQRSLCDTCSLAEYEEFAHTCVHELISKNQILSEKYKIGHWGRWDYDMESANLSFSERQGDKAKVICEMEVVGSVQGDSWEWSWGNKNLPNECRSRMDQVNAFGEEKEWEKLTTLFLNDDEYLGWECASISSHVLNGIGAYRCPSKDGFVYLVILSAKFVN